MKSCGYCGRENQDDATHCIECGTLEFVGPLLPLASSQQKVEPVDEVLDQSPRPSAVKLAIVLLVIGCATDLVLTTVRYHSTYPHFYFLLAWTFTVEAVLLWFLYLGRNWTRWVALFAVVLSVIPHVQRHSVAYFIYLLVDVIALIALFRRSSSQWFRRHVNAV